MYCFLILEPLWKQRCSSSEVVLSKLTPFKKTLLRAKPEKGLLELGSERGLLLALPPPQFPFVWVVYYCFMACLVQSFTEQFRMIF